MNESLKKAGNIHRKVIHDVKRIVKPEVSFLEIFNFVENKIKDLGGKPAFPVNISLNYVAAHDTPLPNDPRKIKEGDIVKVDIGVHVDGWIVDGAITIEVNDTRYKNMIKSTEDALKNAIKTIKKGVYVSNVGEVIEKTLKSKNYSPIYNLYGHKIERYNLHAGINIPNYNNKSTTRIESGIYAIEPFSTTGSGYVRDYKQSSIYSIIGDLRRIRVPSVKKIAESIYKEFRTLPFSKLQLYNHLGDNKIVDLAINFMKTHGILYEYSVLIETSKNIVVQSETTVFVDNYVQDIIGIYTQ